MKLPNAKDASVAEAKITKYLLNPTHPAGGSKAAFFLQYGFSLDRWHELAEALRMHGRQNDVVDIEQTRYGVRYAVDGALVAPDGRVLNVRSAWYIDIEGGVARFVTAHPLPRL
jgi:hypothetical protein